MEITLQGVIVPFILGVIVGCAIKIAVKFVTLLVLLFLVLVGAGALSLSSESIYNSLTWLWNTLRVVLGTSSITSILPVTSVFFLAGVVVGYFFIKA